MSPMKPGWIIIKLLQPTQSDLRNFTIDQTNEP